MPRYLITGGAGFIGSNLAHALAARGESVRILDDFSTGRPQNLQGIENRVEIVRGDLRDPDAVARAVRGVEIVLHQAALNSI
ncbi:MAG TPA: NAD-dependent epimerase/dehydratase family protein, partial [Candidatus Acidoferrum sp.]|nr:NAD-dependent epimerase/dehydratase family protein [Candidatus Acidoferrum sp.]